MTSKTSRTAFIARVCRAFDARRHQLLRQLPPTAPRTPSAATHDYMIATTYIANHRRLDNTTKETAVLKLSWLLLDTLAW